MRSTEDVMEKSVTFAAVYPTLFLARTLRRTSPVSLGEPQADDAQGTGIGYLLGLGDYATLALLADLAKEAADEQPTATKTPTDRVPARSLEEQTVLETRAEKYEGLSGGMQTAKRRTAKPIRNRLRKEVEQSYRLVIREAYNQLVTKLDEAIDRQKILDAVQRTVRRRGQREKKGCTVSIVAHVLFHFWVITQKLLSLDC